MVELLKEYVDIFAWSYQDMPGLDTDIVEHRLPLKPECPPVKQKLRISHPDMADKLKNEVLKQIDAGFLVTSVYPQWIDNIKLVPKKDRKAVKGSALAEYLAHQPIDDRQSIIMDFPDEDIMYSRAQDWDEPFPEEGPDPGSKW